MFIAIPDEMTSSMKEQLEMIQVLGVDGCILENGKFHKTKKYDIMQREAGLVIRRGQDFYLNVTLNRDYDGSTDELTLVLNMEGETNIFDVNDKTKEISIPLMNTFKPGKSSASLDTVGIHSIKIKVFLPADICIAKYRLTIETNTKSVVSRAASFKINELLYIIFNPWCRDDDVFVGDEEHRQEYVLSEDGLIWTGNAGHMKAVPWAFRHFSKDVLDCAFYLINAKSNIDVVNRASPIHVSRALSALANANDYDEGILLGRWDGNYTDGKHPCAWVGSSDIIQKYHKEKNSIKYGQCWVYGGVLATLCRTLGIPSRVVTNFESAHDTNGNLRIERCFDSQGKEIQDEEFTSDSVWNFHVWNEVWMKRMDLEDEFYDGWQVIDATPQETSSDDDGYRGQYACGPVPVLAIKLGDLDVPYDGKFVFAEVNADVYYYRKSKTYGKKMFDRVDQHRVGQNISTKAVGSYQRQDITDTYKFPEDSIENRESFHKARTHCQDAGANEIDCPATSFSDIKFELDATKNVEVGQPISIVLSMKNESDKTHDVSTKLVFNAYQYTGKKIDFVKQTKADVPVGPKDSKIVNLDISWEDYKDTLMSTCMFKVICLCSVSKENFDYFTDLNIQLIKPKIKIDAEEVVGVNEKLEATMSFTNPLPINLTNGQFRVIAPGLEKNLKIKLDNIVEPGAVASCNFTSIPRRKGNSTIIVNFESTELNGIEGFLPIKIVKNLSLLPPTIVASKPDDVGASDKPEAVDLKPVDAGTSDQPSVADLKPDDSGVIVTEATIHKPPGETASTYDSTANYQPTPSTSADPAPAVDLIEETEPSSAVPDDPKKSDKPGLFASMFQCFSCKKKSKSYNINDE